jgi:catechol 2,3-dioxygenase-like lactoylglutathione lyase family enzyme
MDWKLEVIVIPVSDVERAKNFYVNQAGFQLDVDHSGGGDMRVVQTTPPGSSCSVTFGVGLSQMEPGSIKGLQLVVDDVEAARAELAERGVEVSPVRHMTDSGWADGFGGDWNSFVFFDDPDGNSWAVQQKPADGAS